MSTSIFFTVSTDNPDSEPCVTAQIYNAHGRMLASHTMTIEGAEIRMHDLQAALEEARGKRAKVTADDLICTCGHSERIHGGEFKVCEHSDCECMAFEPETNDDDSPTLDITVRGVYAAKLDGSEYHCVGESLDDVMAKHGEEMSFGQCERCGSFNAAGDPVAAHIDAEHMRVKCDGCGREVSITIEAEAEVVF